MTAKEYLSQAFWLDRRIDSRLEQLASLKNIAERTTSAMSDVVVSRTRNTHGMEDVIAKIIDMQEEINRDIDRLVDLKREIMQVVHAVEDPELQMLLDLRYLSFKSWQEVAAKMGYNIRHIYRLHDLATEQITVPEAYGEAGEPGLREER